MSETEDRFDTPVVAREAGRPIVAAVVAAMVAALIGAVVWGLIVKTTDYEVGIVAWGIGFIVGTAVVTAMGGARGYHLQAIAVVASLAGVLLGKYLSFAFVLQDQAEEVGVDIGLFSGDMIDFFFDDLDAVFSLFDVLWIGLAVFTAWRIPRPEPEPGPGPGPKPAA